MTRGVQPVTKFLFYEGRHGERMLLPHNKPSWDYLINEMEKRNGMTIEQARAEGFWVDGGTYEEGYISIGDGGSIHTIESGVWA